MGHLNDDSICLRCKRRENRHLTTAGLKFAFWACVSAQDLARHATIFECDLTVTDCEQFKEKEEKEDGERRNQDG